MMEKLSEKYIPLIEAVLILIRQEMDRLYWNENQKEMMSPFDNTGTEYHNDVFSVMAYQWEQELINSHNPNFKYKDLEVFWYKYLGRGTQVFIGQSLTVDFLADMIKDCFDSLREDFAKM